MALTFFIICKLCSDAVQNIGTFLVLPQVVPYLNWWWYYYYYYKMYLLIFFYCSAPNGFQGLTCKGLTCYKHLQWENLNSGRVSM